MPRYRDLRHLAEYAPLFWTITVRSGAMTLQGIALGVLVYERTGSPLFTSLAMFGPSFAQLLGAVTLLSLADRVPPRAALITTGLTYGASAALATIPGLPVLVILALVGAGGLVGTVSNGVQWGLLAEIVPSENYLLGRSLFTMSNGVMQMLGYGVGGLLVAVTSPVTALLLAAGVHLTGAAVARLGLTRRAPRASGTASIRATWADNRTLWSTRRRRRLFIAMWVPNGLIVGCESVFVPYSPRWAGVLFAASALGMLAGDVLVARVLSPAARRRFRTSLRLLLAAPYLTFALGLPIAVAVGAVLVASIGYGSTLLLQEELLSTVPRSLTGHTLGLHSCGLLSMQAVGATLAGVIASLSSPTTTIVALAVASVAVTLAVTLDAPRRGRDRPVLDATS